MRKHIVLISLFVTLISSSSCTKKICAAYGSYFLLNEQAQMEYFSPFDMGEDSVATPKKSYKSSIDGNGIAHGPTPKNFRKKHYQVPMKDYMVIDEDSTSAPGDSLMDSFDETAEDPDFN